MTSLSETSASFNSPGRLQTELRCLCFSRYSGLMIAEGADGPVRSDLAMAPSEFFLTGFKT